MYVSDFHVTWRQKTVCNDAVQNKCTNDFQVEQAQLLMHVEETITVSLRTMVLRTLR